MIDVPARVTHIARVASDSLTLFPFPSGVRFRPPQFTVAIDDRRAKPNKFSAQGQTENVFFFAIDPTPRQQY